MTEIQHKKTKHVPTKMQTTYHLFLALFFLRRWHHLTPSKVSRQILPKWRWIEKPSERFSSCCHHQSQRGAGLELNSHKTNNKNHFGNFSGILCLSSTLCHEKRIKYMKNIFMFGRIVIPLN